MYITFFEQCNIKSHKVSLAVARTRRANTMEKAQALSWVQTIVLPLKSFLCVCVCSCTCLNFKR